jgi:hypothetical protein
VPNSHIKKDKDILLLAAPYLMAVDDFAHTLSGKLIKIYPLALEILSPTLKANRERVLDAVRKNQWVLEYASIYLRNDK